MKLEEAVAKETSNGGIPVIWIDGAACTGCSMTLLNSVFYTTVEDLLINTLDLNFHKTVMTAAGSPNATGANALTAVRNAYTGADNITGVPLYVLVVEGGIQCALTAGTLERGGYCKNGQLTTVAEETMLANVQLLASHALAVLSVGTCASFGGIPGAKGSATDSRGTLYSGTSLRGALVDPKVAYSNSATAFDNAVTSYGFTSTSPITNILGQSIKDVTINISGCPPHPDWIVGTVAHIISNLPPIATLAGLVIDGDIPALKSTLSAALPPVTSYKRPVDYGYGEYQCNAGPCTWRYNNITRRAKNTDSYDPNAWQPPILIGSPVTTPWTTSGGTWTSGGGPAGTTPSPSITYYTSEPDWNPRYPTGDSKALGLNKWKNSSDIGCLGILGCKGRKTKADCSRRRWNTDKAENYGVNWCVGSRGNCHGCTEPTFPDKVGKFYTFI